jgi:predicted transcriptional regulator
MARKKAARAVSIRQSPKTTPEKFIATVMKHADGTIAAVADELGVSHQAVSKRLKEYRQRGVKGLPDFDARSVDLQSVQALVNKYKGK